MSPILLDSAIGIIILLSAVFAYFRGFVKEVLTIVNLAGAAAAAFFLGPQLRPFFNEQFGVTAAQDSGEKAAKVFGLIPPEIMAAFSAYAAAFFAVFLVLTLAGLYIAGTVKAMGLGPADKFFGVIFGLARGFLLVFLFYVPIAFSMSPEKYPQWAKESVSVQVLQDTYKWADAYLNEEKREMAGNEEPVDPDSLKGRLKKAAENLSQTREEAREKAAAQYERAKENAQSAKENVQNVTEDILTDAEKERMP